MAKARTPRTTTNGKKQTEPIPETNVATMPSSTPTTAVPSTDHKKFAPPIPINVEEEIRRRAYELYEQRGCAPGQDHLDWVEAEREVLARYTQQQSA
ncbi:MAG TPA: DUF2934 domain-containing protein [Terriglobales bacterium]|nr:DUF2934 domain-containing protein [Terriglobales bacterium]